MIYMTAYVCCALCLLSFKIYHVCWSHAMNERLSFLMTLIRKCIILFFNKNQKLSLKIAIKNFFLWQKNWKDMRGYFQTNSKCNYSIFCGYVCKKLHQKNQKEKPFLKAWPIKNAYNSCYLTKLSNLCKYIPVESLAAYVMNND